MNYYNSRLFKLFTLITSCTFSYAQKNLKHTPITIWIHGTRLHNGNIFKKFQDYKPGLHPAKSYPKQFHMHSIAQALFKANPHKFNIEDFYFYGWSGKLCFKERKKEAFRLYTTLIALIKKYKEQGKKPYLQIITHSHGGNVAIQLPCAFEKYKDTIKIDELILLACPVQNKTKDLLQSSCFKKVYALFSQKDLIQVLDPQGLYQLNAYKQKKFFPLFSERIFPSSDNLIQAEIKINDRCLYHIEFIIPPFINLLPKILKQMDEKRIPQQIDPLLLHFKSEEKNQFIPGVPFAVNDSLFSLKYLHQNYR